MTKINYLKQKKIIKTNIKEVKKVILESLIIFR